MEDWFQVENLRGWFPPTTWHQQQSRVEQNTNNLLDLFDSFDKEIKATFFILGWVAQKYPQLVTEINNRGHEVASHGLNHAMCTQLAPADLASDLEQSKKLLEDISGNEVSGYRAPSFSVNDTILLAIQAAGYSYDSSYNNFSQHGRYGRLSTEALTKRGIAYHLENGFCELPVSNLQLGRRIVPWGGGGYFRFFPSLLFNAGVRKILDTDKAYLFYLHPWEIDPGQPRSKTIKGPSAWRHYLNLNKTFIRLTKMIETFGRCSFMTCTQYLTHVVNIPNTRGL